MSAILPRPGVVLGAYPERVPGGDDQNPRGVLARLARRRAQRPRDRRRFLDRVQRAEGELAAAGALSAARDRLCRRLMRDGLDVETTASALALVRAATAQSLGLRQRDCQLLGARVLLDGGCAEMQTGEGKTLTAPLAAATAALAGCPVHVVTANDYLARRDAELTSPIYAALGLTVGAITADVAPEARREVYARDVVYCSDKQLVFDYLHDRVTRGEQPGELGLRLERVFGGLPRLDRLRMRGLCFAIVDEADSVLIDQARTPLILSRQTSTAPSPRLYGEALRIASALEAGRDFVLDTRRGRVELTGRGERRAGQLAADDGTPFTGTRERNALVATALRALHLYHRDRHYLLTDDGVQIVDPDTGRTLRDRRWQGGLHQLIEVKEGCAPSPGNETLARISYQDFFCRYLKLAGMTGTAREVRRELAAVYGLRTVAIAPHRPCRRRAEPPRLYARAAQKHAALVERVREVLAEGRPVLVGTRSVEASEQLADCLRAAGLSPTVLNARQDAEEAAVVAAAGAARRCTVATNMAGRGTDIALAPGVAERGGLHVVVAEPNESRRVDRQLIGRCARQGEPGSHGAILALDDEVLVTHLPAPLRALAARLTGPARPLPAALARGLVALAQTRAERRGARARRALSRAHTELSGRLGFAGSGG